MKLFTKLTDHDIDELRSETMGCSKVIHLNYAGAGLVSTATVRTMQQYIELEATHGAMEAVASVAFALSEARELAAQLIGAKASEIAFLSSGSLAWGSAFAALPKWHAGDRIFVSRQEWGSNVSVIKRAALRTGALVEVIPCRDDGSIDVHALECLIDDSVKLIAVTWLPANGGLVNDATGVGRIAKAARIPYFIDAGQAVGQLPVDVNALGCDVLKSAGRKHLRGPRGTAILFVREGFMTRLEPAFFDVHGVALGEADVPVLRQDARRFEMQEMSIVALLGLREAMQQAVVTGNERIWARIDEIAQFARRELTQVPGVTIHDLGSRHSGLVSFTLNGISPVLLKERLAEKRINIGANNLAYTPLDMRARGIREIARISVSYLTTATEIEQTISAIRTLS
jgi:cysteine desulfurase / selenocysteine lyase